MSDTQIKNDPFLIIPKESPPSISSPTNIQVFENSQDDENIKISKPFPVTPILSILLLSLGLIASILLINQRQDIRSEASFKANSSTCCLANPDGTASDTCAQGISRTEPCKNGCCPFSLKESGYCEKNDKEFPCFECPQGSLPSACK